MDISVFTKMSYGVYVVSALDHGRPTGCVANSIMQVTVEPVTVAVSMSNHNYTYQCIEESGKFGFSILSEQADPALIGTFGFRSGKDMDKFAGVDYELIEGVPVLKDSCGYVVCRVADRLVTATHTVFLGEVLDAGGYDAGSKEMTYAYYHQVVKGRSPKNAPTYLQEQKKKEEKKTNKYVCEVCGYIYEGEELPADYVCPICGVGPDRFRKL